MKKLLFYIVLLTSGTLYGQTEKEKLAAHYFGEEEYTKAADLYEDLAKKNPGSMYFYENLLVCYFKSNQFKQADKLVSKRIKQFPGNYNFKVDEGHVLEQKGDQSAANKVYDKLLKQLVQDDLLVEIYAKAFEKRGKYDYAIKCYKTGRKLFKDPFAYALELADLYHVKGENDLVISEYLNVLEEDESVLKDIKDKLAAIASEKEYELLQTQLLKRISKNSASLALNDLLMWTFVQRKDWESAYIQTRAIDKRLREEGERMLDLGKVYSTNYEYAYAAKAYNYIVELGKQNPFYFQARKGLLDNKFFQLEKEVSLSSEEMTLLENDLKTYVNEESNTHRKTQVTLKLARFYALYNGKAKEAIRLLEEVKESQGIHPRQMAEVKLDLADYYLMSGDVWEPALLYSQVERAFKEEALGQEAKFRNARLAYFRGEFDWAQTQLDVLKAATTQLISNNAIKLSLFITDNMGLDSTEEPLLIFSRAELMIYQNKFEEAKKELKAINVLYPAHSLEDEILFAKGQMEEKQRNWTAAIGYYEQIAQHHSYDILADNALFKLGDLYQFKLKQPEKAIGYYEKIILEYDASLFVVEARKRYRMLRNLSKEEIFLRNIKP